LEPRPLAAPSGIAFDGDGADGPVLWLSGEHDRATRDVLRAELARAVSLDRDLIVDMGGVEFLDASTIAVILEARTSAGLRSRALTVRAPSAFASRIFDLCGLELTTPECARVESDF
jgi:anti-anti-sigma factor